jgi:hypothetical protein
MGLRTSIANAHWLRRGLSGCVALLSALVILPVPVLAAVTFTGSWTPTYFSSASNGNATPPTPTFGDALSGNGTHGQTDVLSVDMGTYSETNPSSDATKQSFETITLSRPITWSPSKDEHLNANWTLDAFLNSKAQGIDQVTVLTTSGTVVRNLLDPQKYNGGGNTPSEINKGHNQSLSPGDLPSGNYILQVTVRYQTLEDNKIGGQWKAKSGSHLFDFFAK